MSYKDRKEYNSAYFRSPVGKQKMRNYRQSLRKKVIEYLGGKCNHCNFSDIRALQLDHVNGGGSKDRTEGQSWSRFYNEVLRGEHPHKIQVLCANCNWIKLHEAKEGFVRPLHKE